MSYQIEDFEMPELPGCAVVPLHEAITCCAETEWILAHMLRACVEAEMWVAVNLTDRRFTPGGMRLPVEATPDLLEPMEQAGLIERADEPRYWNLTDAGKAALSPYHRKRNS